LKREEEAGKVAGLEARKKEGGKEENGLGMNRGLEKNHREAAGKVEKIGEIREKIKEEQRHDSNELG